MKQWNKKWILEGIEKDVSQRGSSVQSYNTIAGVRCLAKEMLPAGLISAQTKNGRPAGCYTHDAGKPWQQQPKMTVWTEQASVMLSSSREGWNPVSLFISISMLIFVWINKSSSIFDIL